MAPTGAKKKDQDKSTGEVISDLWQLVRDYAVQETVDPLKAIKRFLGFGIPGAIFLGMGVLFAVLAIIRGLQDLTGNHLTGSYTWVPYLVAFVATAVIVALSVRAISKPNKNAEPAR